MVGSPVREALAR
jgi:hypothetical protein